MTERLATTPLLRVLTGKREPSSADLAHAAGGQIPSGIPGYPPKGRKLPRSLLRSEACGRADVAADSPVRLRRGHPLFRHSGGAACARAVGALYRGRRSAARRACRPFGAEEVTAGDRSREAGVGLRSDCAGEARFAAGRRAVGLLRRSLDRRDLHDRWLRHAGSGSGAIVCLSASRSVRDAHRSPGGGLGELSGSAV